VRGRWQTWEQARKEGDRKRLVSANEDRQAETCVKSRRTSAILKRKIKSDTNDPNSLRGERVPS